MRSSTSAATVASSEAVGSSATRRAGSPASAMARKARCLCPPERRCGYSARPRSGSGKATSASSSRARAGPRRGRSGPPERRAPRRSGNRSCGTGSSAAAGSWKDERDSTAANGAPVPLREPGARSLEGGPSPERRAPSGRRSRRARARSVLPQPLSPTTATLSPAAMSNGHAVDGRPESSVDGDLDAKVGERRGADAGPARRRRRASSTGRGRAAVNGSTLQLFLTSSRSRTRCTTSR